MKLIYSILKYLFGIAVLLASGVSIKAKAAAYCPPLPLLTPIGTITHDPSADKVIYFDIATGKASDTASNSAYRSLQAYKQPFDFETDTLPGNKTGHVISYYIDAVSGSPTSTVNPTLNFDQAINGLPNWRGTNGTPLPTASMTWTVPRNQGTTGTYKITIPKNQTNAPAGTSTIEFASYIYYGQNSTSCAGFYAVGNRAFKTQTFNYYVPYSASMNIAGAGTSGTMNFDGPNGLKTGEKKSINLNISSNDLYKVSIDSANNGFLKNTASGLSGELIPYTVKLGTSTITEANAYNSTSATNGTETKALEVTIGNTDNARQGTYRDTIVITISQQ